MVKEIKSFRDILIDQIKLLAKDLYENAEKYIPAKDYMTDFDIWMHFPRDCSEAPSTEVVVSFLPDDVEALNDTYN